MKRFQSTFLGLGTVYPWLSSFTSLPVIWLEKQTIFYGLACWNILSLLSFIVFASSANTFIHTTYLLPFWRERERKKGPNNCFDRMFVLMSNTSWLVYKACRADRKSYGPIQYCCSDQTREYWWWKPCFWFTTQDTDCRGEHSPSKRFTVSPWPFLILLLYFLCPFYRLTMLRQWSLYESLIHTDYVASYFQAWREQGEHDLRVFLAKIGYSCVYLFILSY